MIMQMQMVMEQQMVVMFVKEEMIQLIAIAMERQMLVMLTLSFMKVTTLLVSMRYQMLV